jgi:hypothetical protein
VWFWRKKNRQNGVKQLSAFCSKAVFGNMSVHRLDIIDIGNIDEVESTLFVKLFIQIEW